MFCLKCFHWWPIGSRYCGICQRPFNARLCSKEHANPLWGPQHSCNSCNLPLLQQGVPAIGMDWLAAGITVLLLLGLCYQSILHLDWVFMVGQNAFSWLLDLVMRHIPAGCYILIENLIAWWICLYLLSHLLPKDMGGPFRGWLSRCAQTGFRLAGAGAVTAGKGMVSLFQAALRSAQPKELPRSRRDKQGREDEDYGP